MANAWLNIYTMGICGFAPENVSTGDWHLILPTHSKHLAVVFFPHHTGSADQGTWNLLKDLGLKQATAGELRGFKVNGQKLSLKFVANQIPSQPSDDLSKPFPHQFSGSKHNYSFARVANLEEIVGTSYAKLAKSHLTNPSKANVASVMSLSNATLRTYLFARQRGGNTRTTRFLDDQGGDIFDRAITAIVHARCLVEKNKNGNIDLALSDFQTNQSTVEEIPVKPSEEPSLLIGNLDDRTSTGGDHFQSFYKLCSKVPSHKPIPTRGSSQSHVHTISLPALANLLRPAPGGTASALLAKSVNSFVSPPPAPPTNWIKCPPAQYAGIE